MNKLIIVGIVVLCINLTVSFLMFSFFYEHIEKGKRDVLDIYGFLKGIMQREEETTDKIEDLSKNLTNILMNRGIKNENN